MRLIDLVDQFVRLHDYGLSRGAEDQYRWSVAALEKWKGAPLDVSDLSDDLVNGYLDWMRDNRKPDTIRTRRGNLLTLWRFAYENRFTDTAPRKIRKLRRRRNLPTAWTAEEVTKLVASAGELEGKFAKTQVDRRLLWRSLILAAWDSALRLGDLLAVERDWIQSDGSMVIRQSKTGDEILVRFDASTLRSIDEVMVDPPRRLVWPLWCRRDEFYKQFKALVKRAEIREGTFKWIRRASITAVEMQQRGAGTPHAGHRTRSVTESSYLDQRQLHQDRPLPPPIIDDANPKP